MTNQPDESESRRKKRIRYFLLSYTSLFLGALFSGADSAFFGIGFACAIFFLFMVLMNVSLKGPQRTSPPPRSSQRAYPPPPHTANATRGHGNSSSAGNIFAQLTDIFQRARAQFAAAPDATKGRIVSVAFIGGMILFFLIVFFSIGSDDYATSEFYIADQGDQYYNTGQYDSAALYYRIALAEDPEQLSALRGMGNVSVSREFYDSGLYYYDKVLAIDPADETALNGKGLCYYYLKEYDAAINTCRTVLIDDPTDTDALLLTADSYYAQQLYDSAIRYYEPGYNLGVRSRLLCHIMAFIYDTKGQYDKAVPLYEEALTYDTTIVDIYRRLGEIAPGEKAEYYRRKMQQFPR